MAEEREEEKRREEREIFPSKRQKAINKRGIFLFLIVISIVHTEREMESHKFSSLSPPFGV